MALDRRQFTRHAPSALVPVKLGSNNQGMLLNLSEGGLAFQVVAQVATNDTFRFLCDLGPNQTIEATGEITWTGETGNIGGLRFLDLPEGLRKQIAAWLVKVPLEPAPERPLAAPPRDAQEGVSGGAESPAWAAAAPAGRSSESAQIRRELQTAGQFDEPHGDSRPSQPLADWPALGYDWLREPPRKQRVAARATRGRGPKLEGLLIAVPIGIVVVALILWLPAFHSAGKQPAARQQSQTEIRSTQGDVGTRLEQPNTRAPQASVGSGPAAPGASQQAPTASPPHTTTAPTASFAKHESQITDHESRTASHESPITSPAPGEKELVQALRYLNGTYGRKDTPTAITWFWQAVQAGNQEAAVRLAGLYLRGEGVAKNCDQARVLLTLAAQKGNREAARRLDTLSASGCQ